MSEIPENPDNPENPHSPKRLDRLPLSFIIFFIALSLLLGVMAMRLVQNSPATTENGATPTANATTPSGEETQSYVLFVPNENAMLSQETVTDSSTSVDAPYSEKAKRALELLFPKIEFLPPGTTLLAAPTKDNNGVVRVNLSKEFMKLDSQPDTPVMLTLDAMARTLGALDSTDGKTFESAKMQVLIDGKTVQTFSQFSLDEPWTASETSPQTPAAEDAI